MDRKTLKTALQEILLKNFPNLEENDFNIIIELCLLVSAVTGKERPKEFLRNASDKLIQDVILNENLKQHPVLGKIYSLFFIENQYRLNNLETDWIWVWDSSSEGRAIYKFKNTDSAVEVSHN